MANQAVDHSKVTGGKGVDGPLSPSQSEADSRPDSEEADMMSGESITEPSPH